MPLTFTCISLVQLNFLRYALFDSMSLSYLVTLALAGLAIAVPAPPSFPAVAAAAAARPAPGKRTCDTNSAKLAIPSTISILATPSGPPSSVALGIGFQNYTCTTAGNYTYVQTAPMPRGLS